MAQNVTIAGTSYANVPAIDIPKTGGGTARFVDTTDANAASGDLAQGKTAYVNGQKLVGTAAGGRRIADGAITLSSATNQVSFDPGFVPTFLSYYVTASSFTSTNLVVYGHNSTTEPTVARGYKTTLGGSVLARSVSVTQITGTVSFSGTAVTVRLPDNFAPGQFRWLAWE